MSKTPTTNKKVLRKLSRKNKINNKGGKRKIRKTKKSKKNKRKTRRIKGGLSVEQAHALRDEIHILEHESQQLLLRLQNIENGNRKRELDNPTKVWAKNELDDIIYEERTTIERDRRNIFREQSNKIMTLIMNGYDTNFIGLQIN